MQAARQLDVSEAHALSLECDCGMAPSQKAFDDLLRDVIEIRASLKMVKWIVGLGAPTVLAAAFTAIGWCVHLSTKVAVIESGGDTRLVTKIETSRSPQQLQAGLTTVLAQVQTAEAEGKKPDPDKLRIISKAVGKAVSANPAVVDGWRTAAALINYEYSPLSEKLPDCVDATPTQLSWVPLHPEKAGTPPPHQFTVANCQLNLDDPLPASKFSPIGAPNTFTIVCQACLVTYSGGAIPLTGIPGYINLIFSGCRFSISAPKEPPPAGKSFMEAVLARDDTDRVSLSLSGEG
jgi:hypothetical protein